MIHKVQQLHTDLSIYLNKWPQGKLVIGLVVIETEVDLAGVYKGKVQYIDRCTDGPRHAMNDGLRPAYKRFITGHTISN